MKQTTILFLAILVVGCISASGWWFNNQRTTKNEHKSELQVLIERLDEVVELPTDETPTLASVTQAEALRDQSFFAKAENGDQVLVYLKSSRAVLYRPSTRKVIEVGPVHLVDTCTINPQDSACKR